MSLRERLRWETADLHRRTEQAVDQYASLQDRQGYGRFLRAMGLSHAAHATLLDSVARRLGLAPLGADLLAAIERDLSALQTHRPASSPESRSGPGQTDETDRSYPTAAPPLTVDRWSEALGVAYVFEGSALGATVLCGEMQDRFGKAIPLAYFSLLRAQRGRRWPRLIEALSEPDLEPSAVLAGARRAFASIAGAIQRQGDRLEPAS